MSKASNTRNQGAFLALLALLDGPKHGYEVAQFIEARSNGFFRLPFGTLYPVLHRLEKDGLVEVTSWETGSERSKKVYRLTKAGRKKSQADVDEYQLFSTAMNKLVQC